MRRSSIIGRARLLPSRPAGQGGSVAASPFREPLQSSCLRAIVPIALAIVLTVTFTSCRAPENTSQGVAERFVDQHYVEINLAAAKPFCTGLALQKVQNEQRLTEGQVIDDSTRKPTVQYRLIEKKDDGDSTSFVFEGTIRVEDADKFTRKWLITTRRHGDAWKVSNFEEFD